MNWKRDGIRRGSPQNSGDCSMDPVVGRHRKRAPKRKKWRVEWTWTGNVDELDRIGKMLHERCSQPFATEKQAKQALADWEQGRGIYGAIKTPARGWVAHVIPPRPADSRCRQHGNSRQLLFGQWFCLKCGEKLSEGPALGGGGAMPANNAPAVATAPKDSD